jgi:parallel beta-helix repeat protein
LIEIDGSQAGGSAQGLRLNGGSSLVQGLVLNRFNRNGIRINSDDNTLRCNYIGSDVSGSNPAGNGGDGVFITTASTRNRLEDNVIFSNNGLGIDLDTNGVTPNDPDDGDSGANELQNFPILTAANSFGPFLHLSGILNSTPSSSFRLEFFANSSCDPSGQGEGERPLGTVTRSTDGNGDDVFLFIILPASVPAGEFITATATDDNGNTSEFSACEVVN